MTQRRRNRHRKRRVGRRAFLIGLGGSVSAALTYYLLRSIPAGNNAEPAPSPQTAPNPALPSGEWRAVWVSYLEFAEMDFSSESAFRADAAAEQERRLAAVSVEYRPVESFSGTAVGRGFRIEKEVGTGGFVSGGRFEVARRPDPERFDNTESPILQSEAVVGRFRTVQLQVIQSELLCAYLNIFHGLVNENSDPPGVFRHECGQAFHPTRRRGIKNESHPVGPA